MRIKKEFILHQAGDEYMAVAVGEATKDFSGLIRLNEVGAYIWNLLKEDTTKEKIVDSVCENFEQAERETVVKDVTEFLQTIKEALIYDENEI